MKNMAFIETIKEKIGDGVYAKLNAEAEKEVALAMQMPLVDQYRQEKYYRARFWVPLLLEEHRIFEDAGLRISPIDVVNIIFRCRLFFAVTNEKEYVQRSGGGAFPDDYSFSIPWSERSKKLEDVLEIYFERLSRLQKERILMTQTNSFKAISVPILNRPEQTAQEFFEQMFKKLKVPFRPFFKGEHLIELHKQHEPGLSSYDLTKAEYLFQPTSFGHQAYGSEMYCRLHSGAWLRTFLNLLRIAGFIYPGQIDFGQEQVGLKAPTGPVFLGTHTWGGFSWDEDTKEPWAKIPDGCLFLSFGWRGLSEMWLDGRTFGGIEQFFLEYKNIFEHLQNPWTTKNLYDVMPTLDILSAATQIPDMGAKILQIYCCLEHLFVPKNISKDNMKYIVGAINALKPELLDWFNELYQLRCAYAHRGFVLRDEKTRGVIMQSMKNTMTLLVAKIGTN